MKLKNKVAIVTGGARDIGQAICIKLAEAGAKVVVNYHNSESGAKHTLDAIEKIGGDAIAIQGDITNQSDITNIVNKTKEAFGEHVDILVNNAGGLFARKTLDEIDEEFYNLIMDVNLKGTVFITQAFKPLMSKGSSIVNIASQAGRDGGGPGAFLYAASKGAVSSFTRGLAKELGPQGIRVNAINPGMINTKFHDDFTKDQVRANVANSTPLKREGTPHEVADLVVYLASDESSFITGNNIDINGGLAFS